jgi:hypothetical protein
MALGFLYVLVLLLWATIFMPIGVVVAIDLNIRRLRLLLVTFRGRPLGFLVAVIVCFVLSLSPLALGRGPSIQL